MSEWWRVMSESRVAQLVVTAEVLRDALALPREVSIYRIIQTDDDILHGMFRLCLMGEGLPVPERQQLCPAPTVTVRYRTEEGELAVFDKWVYDG